MITNIVWSDDRKFLQESNVTARQPRRVSIRLYICILFRQRCLAKKELVNLTGIRGTWWLIG